MTKGNTEHFTMDRWSGKVAVVTGASSGIGRSVVEELVKRGVKVVGLARRVENVEKIVANLKGCKGSLKAYKCDLMNLEEIKNAFAWTEKHVGPISILINNAGVMIVNPLNDGNPENLKKVINTNILGFTNCIFEATASMKRNNIDDGHIININSVLGHMLISVSGIGIYSASKHAVTALSESLRTDLALSKSHIKVTSISPGLVETELSAPYLEHYPKDVPKLYDKDVADCVLFALSTPKHVNISELTVQGVGEILGRS